MLCVVRRYTMNDLSFVCESFLLDEALEVWRMRRDEREEV